MRAAVRRAIERGPVGTWQEFPNGHPWKILDPNEWAVAELFTTTQSGQVEIVSVHGTKAAATEFRRVLMRSKPVAVGWGEYTLLKRQPDGTWARA